MLTSTLLATKSDIEVEQAAYQLEDWVPWWWTPGQRYRWRKRIDPWLPTLPGERHICSAEGWKSETDRTAEAMNLCSSLAISYKLAMGYDKAVDQAANIRTFVMAAADATVTN